MVSWRLVLRHGLADEYHDVSDCCEFCEYNVLHSSPHCALFLVAHLSCLAAQARCCSCEACYHPQRAVVFCLCGRNLVARKITTHFRSR